MESGLEFVVTPPHEHVANVDDNASLQWIYWGPNIPHGKVRASLTARANLVNESMMRTTDHAVTRFTIIIASFFLSTKADFCTGMNT
jgi:hypothetical protein